MKIYTVLYKSQAGAIYTCSLRGFSPLPGPSSPPRILEFSKEALEELLYSNQDETTPTMLKHRGTCFFKCVVDLEEGTYDPL